MTEPATQTDHTEQPDTTALADTTASAAKREPVNLPEAVIKPLPGEAAVLPPAHRSVIVLKPVLEQAEKNLAQYVRPYLIEALKAKGESPADIDTLLNDCQIDLSDELNHTKTDIKITLLGTHVGSNEALLGNLLVEALKAHPQFSAYWEGEHKLHAQKVKGAEHTQIQVHIPGLEEAEYAQLMQSLAASVAPVTLSAHAAKREEPQADAADTAAHGAQCSCANCERPATPDAAQTDAPVLAEQQAEGQVAVNENAPVPQVDEVADHAVLAQPPHQVQARG